MEFLILGLLGSATLTAAAFGVSHHNHKKQLRESDRANQIPLKIPSTTAYQMVHAPRIQVALFKKKSAKCINVWNSDNQVIYQFIKLNLYSDYNGGIDLKKLDLNHSHKSIVGHKTWVFCDVRTNKPVAIIDVYAKTIKMIDSMNDAEVADDENVHDQIQRIGNSNDVPEPDFFANLQHYSKNFSYIGQRPVNMNYSDLTEIDINSAEKKHQHLLQRVQTPLKRRLKNLAQSLKTEPNKIEKRKLTLVTKKRGQSTHFKLNSRNKSRIVSYRWMNSSGYLEKIKNEGMEYDEIHERVALVRSGSVSEIDYRFQIDESKVSSPLVLCTSFIQIMSAWDKKELHIVGI